LSVRAAVDLLCRDRFVANFLLAPGGYKAPRALTVLSQIHKEAHIPPTDFKNPAPLRYFMFAAAIGLISSTIIGVIMAYRFSRQPIVATVCLAIGIITPAALLLIYK
jgi:hypothetical protein